LNEIVVSSGSDVGGLRRKTLAPYDKLLHKFRYNQALDAALSTKNLLVIVSMFEELIQRKALRTVIVNRNENQLYPVLVALIRGLRTTLCSKTFIKVLNVILDEFMTEIGQSPKIDAVIKGCLTEVGKEMRVQRKLQKTMGIIDMVLSNANV